MYTKIQTCFNCYKIGHISETCKCSSSLFCGNFPHEKNVICLAKALSLRCINCQSNWLFYIIHLAVIDNISLIEAKRKIRFNHSNRRSSLVTDLRFDFSNYTYLNSEGGLSGPRLWINQPKNYTCSHDNRFCAFVCLKFQSPSEMTMESTLNVDLTSN
ncbi:hypothetical protein ALC53_05418 [Atta colombica]|uniref:CCHC-type domain-containing protein n=1 Tax=Atta colombica TaxID=520822 RepID=A0A195BHP9_9HYME|nr:hypothetical protein ALC53_05418 [Atta colombica]